MDTSGFFDVPGAYRSVPVDGRGRRSPGRESRGDSTYVTRSLQATVGACFVAALLSVSAGHVDAWDSHGSAGLSVSSSVDLASITYRLSAEQTVRLDELLVSTRPSDELRRLL